MKKSNTAFTFIELAVVMVIIGFLVGAIMAAQSIIFSSKNQTIIKELSNINSQINNFYLQYNALPGDISNATSYWASATNGDGDGRVCCSSTESIYLWNHLSMAEIMEGNYDGTYADLLDSVPKSKTDYGYYKVHYAGESTDNWNLGGASIYEQTGNFLGLGAPSTSGDYAMGFLDGADAHSLDRKMDDGNASAGRLVATPGTDNLSAWQSGCVDATTFGSSAAGTVNYVLTNDTKSCRLIYFLQGAFN